MTALDDGFVTASRRRRSSAVLHIVGVALLFVSSGMALSTVVEAAYGDGEVTALLVSTALTATTGALLWRFTQLPARVSAASTFAAVAWTWIAVAVFGAVPFVASGALSNFDEALFESISGFTTTGSTVRVPSGTALPSRSGSWRWT